MSNLSLSPNSFFSRTVSSARMQKLITAENRVTALEMGLFDQFKDLFFSNKKEKFLSDMYDFIHRIDTSDRATNFDAIRQVIRDAPLSKVDDFFSARSEVDEPLLCEALRNGRTEVVASYKRFLEFLSESQRSNLLPYLLSAKDQHGDPGLLLALNNGHGNAITAYQSLLELLPAAQRSTHLITLLVPAGRNGIPALDYALKNQSRATVNAYQSLLESIPEYGRIPRVTDLLLTIKIKQQDLFAALATNKIEQVCACRDLLNTVAESERGRCLDELLAPKLSSDPPALLFALVRGHAGAITAFKEVLELIPARHRNASFVALLAAKDGKGKINTSIIDAMERCSFSAANRRRCLQAQPFHI